MRPNRQLFYATISLCFGAEGRALRDLETDLEPMFRMADAPDWPKGTDCGFEGAGLALRSAEEATSEIGSLDIIMDDHPVEPETSRMGSMNLAERFHDQVCSVLDYGHLVEIGSLLGRTLLDPLFERISKEPGGASWYHLSILSLYRVAVTAAGLETEAVLLGMQIRSYFKEVAILNERAIADSYEDISVVRAVG